MDSQINLKLSFTILIAVLITSNCLCQEDISVSQVAVPAEPNIISLPDFPYFAEITGNDVYIRSGPGTNYYRCGKLKKSDIVKIVSAKNVWSRILPSQESFSWISKQYVTIDMDNPDMGIVTGDEVRVYAGSQYFEPIHSSGRR